LTRFLKSHFIERATSLWRRIRKLEELGYVKVEKRAWRNYVRLL
jgi:uncharacterized membrane protein